MQAYPEQDPLFIISSKNTPIFNLSVNKTSVLIP